MRETEVLIDLRSAFDATLIGGVAAAPADAWDPDLVDRAVQRYKDRLPLTIEEAAVILGVTLKYLREHRHDTVLRAAKYGGRLYYLPDNIDRFIASCVGAS